MNPRQEEDALLVSSRREAVVTIFIWIVALVWTVGYCAKHGYGRSLESLTFVMGFPDWIFWGVVVPWGASTIAACIFSLCLMRDHDLEAEGADLGAGAKEGGVG